MSHGSPGADDRRLAVVIPAHRAERVLDQTLASIAGQDRLPDEVIVVDDASQDRTSAVACSWSDRLPIRVLRNAENLRAGPSRDRGLAATDADLVALLDADDIMLPDHLSTVLARHPGPGHVLTPAYYPWTPGESMVLRPSTTLNPVPAPERQAVEILRWNFLFSGSVVCPADVAAVRGYRNLPYAEDWDLWIRLIASGVRVVGLDHVTILYRRDGNGKSADEIRHLGGLVEILEHQLETATGERREVAELTLRRLRARRLMLEGRRCWAAGDRSGARRRWFAAAVLDRSLRRGTGSKGSTSLRAVAELVRSTRPADRQRHDRAARRLAPGAASGAPK